MAGWAAHHPLFPCRLVPGGRGSGPGALLLPPHAECAVVLGACGCYAPRTTVLMRELGLAGLCLLRCLPCPLFRGGSQVLLVLGLQALLWWGICWPPVPLCVCLLLGCCLWLASWLPLGEVHLALGSPSWWLPWAMWWSGFPTLLLAGGLCVIDPITRLIH